ncbi:MAG: hypothetical protein PHO66_03395 [Eubacteriales bacterium]|nr:hypothetical protein [Eubacteriales bacterium]
MPANRLVLDREKTYPLSRLVFGHNLEHTRSCIHNGLSAQLLRNRKFAGKPCQASGQALEWVTIGETAYFYMDYYDTYTRHEQPEKMTRRNELQSQKMQNYVAGRCCGLAQSGIALQADRPYEVRLVLKSAAPLTVWVRLVSADGGTAYAQSALEVTSNQWNTYRLFLTPCAQDGNARFEFGFDAVGELAVGAASLLPGNHFYGMRPDVVEALQKIGATLLRWPGGNFAGEYRWKDGLLESDMRGPMCSYMENETQPHTHGFDFHEVGIDEFIALCQKIGAEPFLTINLAWDSPEECAQWVEYCNGDAQTTWGSLRARRGHTQPYGVKYWSLGNEMGYGHMEGPNTPQAYAQKAQACAQAMLAIDSSLALFSSGPYPDAAWVQNSAAPLSSVADYISLHSYDPFDIVRDMNFTTLDSTLQSYAQISGAPLRNFELIKGLRAALDTARPARPIAISFDEWNVWYAWYRKPGVAEGIYTARMLNMFCRESYAQNMPVCCYFEPVNEGAILVHPWETSLSANGQVFNAFKAHHTGLGVEVDCATLPVTDAAASLDTQNNTLHVTLVNADARTEQEFLLVLRPAAGIKQVTCTLWQGPCLLPGTRFSQKELPVCVSGDELCLRLPKHSLAVVTVQL